eukprot:16430065-Heterocapsa_arctica.AAC.1
MWEDGCQAAQAAWNMSYEAGQTTAAELPSPQAIEEQVVGWLPTDYIEAVPAATAKGVIILDGGSSEFLVGQINLTKKDVRDAGSSGDGVRLSTANGVVERNKRSPMMLPGGGEVKALIMPEMNLNI